MSAPPTAPRLVAETPKDLLAISARWQDALLRVGDMAWRKAERQFVLAGMRVCREEAQSRRWRGLARVRSILHVRGVLQVQQKLIDRDAQRLLSLLALVWEGGRAPGGHLRIIFSGGAELRLELEALDVAMHDQGAPWRGGRQPRHPA